MTGTAAAVENALNVTLNQYRRPDGSVFYAPANGPSLNLAVPIAFISGLDSFARPTPQDGSGLSYSTCPVGSGVTGAGTGYMGQDFRKIYLNNPTALLGDNLTAAVVAFDAFTPTGGGFTSDPDRYAAAAAPGPLNAPQIACNLNPAIVVSGGEPEVAADISLLNAMAPNAKIRVYEFPSTFNAPPGNTYDGSSAGFHAIMQRILEDHSANVIVNSWTWQSGTAAPDPTVANTMLQAALQGMSFFQAAGDVGAYSGATAHNFCSLAPTSAASCGDCAAPTRAAAPSPPTTCRRGARAPSPRLPHQRLRQPRRAGADHQLAADDRRRRDPAARQRLRVDRGAERHLLDRRHLRLHQPRATPRASAPRATSRGNASNGYGTHAYRSTGGGYVQGYTGVLGTVYGDLPVPAFQATVNSALNTANSTNFQVRIVPDVSIVGDQITTYFREDGSTHSCSGGTSYSTALWGGVGLLVHQANHNLGQPALGMPNYAFYSKTASSTDPLASFYDVPAGEGANPDFSGFNHATANGYDMVTGLGTPKPGLIGANSVLPPQSCQSGSNLTVLVDKATGNVIAYTPVGSWEQTDPATNLGVRWVPLESASGALQGAADVTPNAGVIPFGVVNTCSADSSGSGNVVCTGNDPTIYLINGQHTVGTVNNSAQATGFEGFSGGECMNCNVAVDPLTHKAYVSVGQSSNQAAIMPLDINRAFANPADPTALGALIQLNQSASSEQIVTDVTRDAVLSANENGFVQFIDATTGTVYNYDLGPLPGLVDEELDSTSEDCSTGIAVAPVEFGAFHQMVLLDLTQAAFDRTSGQWGTGKCTLDNAPCATDANCANHCDTAHGQCILGAHACVTDADCPVVSTCANPFSGVGLAAFPELNSDFGVFGGAAITADGSHLGILSTEFGGSQLITFKLPTVAGGTPVLADYVVSTMPNNPDGSAWVMGYDPHTIGAYTSPNTGRQFGVLQNNVSTGSRYLAIIDLDLLLNHTTRDGGANLINNPIPSCCSVPQGTCLAASAVPGCVIRFLPN